MSQSNINPPVIPLPEYVYKTYRLDPTSTNFIFLAGKYSALSQLALTTDPRSFGIAYSTEGSMTPADYVTRLKEPIRSIFICVAHPVELPSTAHTIELGAWVGMITQIGPTPKEVFWLRDSGAAEPLNDHLESKWHQTHTWIDPAHRGKGIAKQMIEAAVTYVKYVMTGTVRQARIRAFTSPDNETSKALYGSRGFRVVGLCTIQEAMIGNGNSIYPFHGRTDWGEDFMNLRVGLIMERVVRREDLETMSE